MIAIKVLNGIQETEKVVVRVRRSMRAHQAK
jgi:hypothetical protein